MATPPTLVSETEGASWDTGTSPKTSSSVAVQAGDVLAVCGLTEDQATTINTPTGGSLTYTLQQSIEVASYCTDYCWTAAAGSTTSFDVAATSSGIGGKFNIDTTVWRGSDGVGASAKTNVASGAPSLAITTQQDNSAILVFVADWNATDGASRTWRTVNGITPSAGNGLELVYFRNASNYTVYGAYWSDAGAAGSKTVGLSAPSGQKYSIIALEIKGAAAAAAASAPPVSAYRRRIPLLVR